jgi:hypothetical protein
MSEIEISLTDGSVHSVPEESIGAFLVQHGDRVKYDMIYIQGEHPRRKMPLKTVETAQAAIDTAKQAAYLGTLDDTLQLGD